MALTLPNTITPNTPENASQVQQNDAALRDELNGVTTVSDVLHKSDTSAQSVAGNFTVSGTLATSKGDVETAFSGYKILREDNGALAGGSTGTLILRSTSAGDNWATPSITSLVAGRAFYFDPADYAASSRTLKLRLRAFLYTNATAPGSNITVGLDALSAVVGTAGALGYTLGSAVAGSTATFTSPASSSSLQTATSDFTAPTAGHYIVAISLSGTTAANNLSQLAIQTQYRQV